jgi:hypothetical protein
MPTVKEMAQPARTFRIRSPRGLLLVRISSSQSKKDSFQVDQEIPVAVIKKDILAI